MLKVGDEKNFSFNRASHVLQEIVTNVNMSMNLFIKEEVCPHCKKKIEKTREVKFVEIYFFIPKTIEKPEQAKLSDTVILGVASPFSLYLLTEDKIGEAIAKSEKFKHLGVN